MAMRKGSLFRNGIFDRKAGVPLHFCCQLPVGCFHPALGINRYLTAAPNRNPSPLGRLKKTTAPRAEIPTPPRSDSPRIKLERPIFPDQETKELLLRSLPPATNTRPFRIGFSRHVIPCVPDLATGPASRGTKPNPQARCPLQGCPRRPKSSTGSELPSCPSPFSRKRLCVLSTFRGRVNGFLGLDFPLSIARFFGLSFPAFRALLFCRGRF